MRATRTFRLFVSSTFADMKAERAALQEHVFPRLQRYCLLRGCRFQAIDLRWGVSQEAGFDHQTIPICLDEIRRCQQLTPRPNFLVLLGQRYGWRPLPAWIAAHEFEALRKGLADPAGAALLDEWYRPDTNAVPPEYRLRPREGQYQDYATWEAVEARLRRALLEGAQSLGSDGNALVSYRSSATEHEIIEGALKAGTDHAFCCFRTIDGLPSGGPAAEFLDLGPDGQVEPDAARCLEELKARLRSHLPPAAVHEYRVAWEPHGIRPEQLAPLCARVYRQLQRAIGEEIDRLEAVDALDEEIEAHRAFAAERAQGFVGRAGVLAAIRDYFAGGHPRPLVVRGVSGCGKSALLAQCARETKSQRPEALVVSRFIGATPQSTDLRALLSALCRQIHREYGHDGGPVPTDLKALQAAFAEALGLASPSKPLMVLLDALDQLGPADDARALNWLPDELPSHARVVLSTIEAEDDRGAPLRAARARWADGSFVELPPLTPEEGAELLDRWLSEAGRTLQPEQRSEILDKFRQCPLPLYLRIVFEEARRWRSYDGSPGGADGVSGLPSSVEGVIRDMLGRLEQPAQHGRQLVRKALGYLAAARSGLTEDELLDLLSGDEEVLAEFRQRSPQSPAVGRLPVVVWSRLRFDLAPYLTERAADRTQLLSFFHRQVGEVVRQRYLAGGKGRDFHRRLAEHFVGRPHWFEGPQGRLPNRRKVSELPYQQTRAGMWGEVAKTLSDLEFVEAKCESGLTFGLVGDYLEACLAAPNADAWPDRERVEAFRGFVTAQAHVLSRYPWLTFQQAANEPAESPVAQAARLRWESGGEARPWFRWRNRPSLAEGRAVTLQGHTGDVVACAIAPGGVLAASGSHDCTVRLWDVSSGECVRVLEGHEDDVSCCLFVGDGSRLLSGSYDHTLRLWDVESGACLHTLQGHTDWVQCCATSPRGNLAVSGAGFEDGTIRLWDLATGSTLLTLATPDGGVTCCAFLPDGEGFVAGDDQGGVRAWSLSGNQLLAEEHAHADAVECCDVSAEGGWLATGGRDGNLTIRQLDPIGPAASVLAHEGGVTCCRLTADGRLVSAGRDGVVKLWDPDGPHCLQEMAGHRKLVVWCDMLPDGRRIVSASRDGTVRIWDVETGECSAVFASHSKPLTCATLLGDGARVISGSTDCTLRVWVPSAAPSAAGEPLHAGAVTSCSLTPDGGRVLSSGDDGSLVLSSLQDGTPLRRFKGHEGAVAYCAVSPDGHTFLSGGEDQTVRLWSDDRDQPLGVESMHLKRVKCCSFSADGSRAVSVGADGRLVIWNGRTLVCQRVIVTPPPRPAIHWCGFTTDGASILGADANGCVSWWHPVTGERQHFAQPRTTPIASCACTRSKALLVAYEDGVLGILDPRTGELQATTHAHEGTISHVRYAPQSNSAVSAGIDGVVKLWTVPDLRVVGQYHLDGPGTSLDVTPTGRTIAAGTNRGELHILDLMTR